MELPKLACCNFFSDNNRLKDFAFEHGFDGVEWTFSHDNIPQTRTEETDLAKAITGLSPLEVRFHAALEKTDPGHTTTDYEKNFPSS